MSEKVNIGYSVKVETKTRIDELAKPRIDFRVT